MPSLVLSSNLSTDSTRLEGCAIYHPLLLLKALEKTEVASANDSVDHTNSDRHEVEDGNLVHQASLE